MGTTRRIVLRVSGAIISSFLAGCTTEQHGPTTTVSPVTSALVESGTGDYPHEIRVLNKTGQRMTLTLTVERDDELLYRKTHTVPKATEQTIAGITRTSLPREEREIRISATLDGQTRSISIRIDDCTGDSLITISSPDDFEITYSVC